MKNLIAIVSCHKNSFFRDCQRKTWLPETEGKADYRFFLGKGDENYQPQLDEVLLDCPDGYDWLPDKVKAICQWAVNNGYDYLFKCDDDTYVIPSRLMLCGFASYDYMGYFRPASGMYKHRYAVGGPGYWLSRLASISIARAELTEDTIEDRWVGNILFEAGFIGAHDTRFVVIISSEQQTPLVNNKIISACELHGEKMIQAHKRWLFGVKPSYISRPVLRPDGTYQQERVFGNINRRGDVPKV